MAKCKQCNKEYGSKRSTSAYCGPKCKQEFYRNRLVTLKPESVTVSDDGAVTVTKHGVEDEKGFDDRGRDVALLKSWVEDKGTPYQQRLGTLSAQYDRIKAEQK